MTEVILWIFSQIQKIINLLDNLIFLDFFGFSVSFWQIIISFFIIFFVISYFWKGAHD